MSTRVEASEFGAIPRKEPSTFGRCTIFSLGKTFNMNKKNQELTFIPQRDVVSTTSAFIAINEGIVKKPILHLSMLMLIIKTDC